MLSLGFILAVIVTAVSVYMLFPPQEENNEEEPELTSIGSRLIKKITSRASDVSWFWSSNNTWINENISTYFSEYIDAFQVANTSNADQAAIFRIPQDTLNATIDISEFENKVHGILDVIKQMDTKASDNLSMDDVFPPTFSLSVAYKDGTSHELIFSQKDNYLALWSGTWSYFDGSNPPPGSTSTTTLPASFNSASKFKTIETNQDPDQYGHIPLIVISETLEFSLSLSNEEISEFLSSIFELELFIQQIFPS
jgi:hypothetical protein